MVRMAPPTRAAEGAGEVSDLRRFIPIQKQLRHEWWSSVLRASISNQIIELRNSRKWTQTKLAKQLGTTQSVIARLENSNSKHAPTISLLLRIASVFDVALIIRFAEWGKAVVFIADNVIPIPYEDELKEPKDG